MGRQINFWMTAIDERAFVERLRRDDVVWTPYALPLGDRPVLLELTAWQPDDQAQRRVLIRRHDWPALQVKDIAANPLPDLHPDSFTPWTQVGCLASPAFEWKTCRRAATYIARGRIYYRTNYFDGKHVYKKQPEVTRWFDTLTAWLRRRGKKWRYNGQYVMPDAARLVDAGDVEIGF